MQIDPEVVLVVEDEGLIRLNLVEDLEDAGLKVIEACDADEALHLLTEHPEIATLFTDIDMPGSMSGLDLAHIIRQSRPDIAILLTSGFLKLPRSELPSDVAYVGKPYDISHVVRHIRAQARRDTA